MATKWKNKLALAAWILLFTFGLSGIISCIFNGNEYFKRDYFQTNQFENQIGEFIDYLSMFELNYIPKEEAKKGIEVTAEDINEHRYRYGDLADQIADIKGQYEYKIQKALQQNNKEIADMYIAERDKKVEDISNNFKNDEHVRIKVVKEKEEKIDNYYREVENYRAGFMKSKLAFKYYLKDTATGKAYSNLTGANDTQIEKLINDKNMLFIRSYPTAKNGYLVTDGHYRHFNFDEQVAPMVGEERRFEGKIAVSKSAPAASQVMVDYHNYQQQQKTFFIYAISCLLAFVLSLCLYKKIPVGQLMAGEKWQSYYKRIPIDIRVGGFLCLGFCTLIWLISIYPPYYCDEYLYISDTLIGIIVAACLITLTFIQGKLLWEGKKHWSGFKAEWPKSFIYMAYQGIKEAFLLRSIGIQVLLLLAMVFAFGAGVIVIIAPSNILIYALLFMLIGIPLLVLIVRNAGRFNRIVISTGELAQGNLGADLPVAGKSVLAVLAGNINTLKHGVKKSLQEQAKSERLKTELITNVSHDLRTPLTSIITYTELLKTPDLTDEDREAYIQIIDRKSKRLKVLIDDLFEASKMASGSVELVKEKVDIGQLLQQALAEHDEAISTSTLQFRVTQPEQPVYVIVDGQKLWRVFDNLIGNILKYALESTRVYIEVQTLQDKVIIIFKNIAKYELGGNVDELFERFKRGDTSRHTEGSGLGLAIAKSIVDLHGGSLDIDLDGDLFKVTVSLPTVLSTK